MPWSREAVAIIASYRLTEETGAGEILRKLGIITVPVDREKASFSKLPRRRDLIAELVEVGIIEDE